MLDTNTISHIARDRSMTARLRLEQMQESSMVYASAITEGEILYGLAKRPAAHQLAYFMHAALAGLKVLPWNREAAAVYGNLRAQNEGLGISLGSLDLLIAAHALSVEAVLVTGDGAFRRLAGGPETMNWAEDVRVN